MAHRRRTYTKTLYDALMRQRAEKMLRDGAMPSLEEVLRAVAETRAKYVSLILASRKGK